MRVVLTHVRRAASGGTERVLEALAGSLAARGHAVTILCRSDRLGGAGALSMDGQAPVVVRELRSPALGAGHRHWVFARDVERWLGRHAGEHDAVLGLGRTWTQDVLRLGGGSHATFLETLGSAARWRPKHRLLLALERRVLAPGSARLFVANSRMVAEDVRARYGLPEERLRVVHNGVDLERFHPRRREAEGARVRAELGIPAAAPVVLFLGSGYARKGLDRVLAAWSPLRARVPAAVLLVVGHDSGIAAWRARAGHGVVLAGGRADPEACYAAADCYVLPTRYDAFANSTLEALASALPVVTTRTNGGAEVIDDGVQGTLLRAPDDPDELAEAVAGWLEPGRRAEGAAAARARAQEHGVESKMLALEALLAEAVGRRAP